MFAGTSMIYWGASKKVYDDEESDKVMKGFYIGFGVLFMVPAILDIASKSVAEESYSEIISLSDVSSKETIGTQKLRTLSENSNRVMSFLIYGGASALFFFERPFQTFESETSSWSGPPEWGYKVKSVKRDSPLNNYVGAAYALVALHHLILTGYEEDLSQQYEQESSPKRRFSTFFDLSKIRLILRYYL